MPIAKAAKTGLKRGRKGKGRKALSPEVKAKAKAAGFTSVKKWEEAGKPGPKTKQKAGTAKRKDTEIPKGKRGSEIRKLERQQKADDMEASGGPRRRKVGPDYLAEKFPCYSPSIYFWLSNWQ